MARGKMPPMKTPPTFGGGMTAPKAAPLPQMPPKKGVMPGAKGKTPPGKTTKPNFNY